ncbi:MAG: AAA family ATPase [Chloroflexi bacterium]|nr:AAA family ATPase [Chloroflexota bacterium]
MVATGGLFAPAEALVETTRRIEREIGRVIVGQREIVRAVLISVLAGGHVLLEGVPGLGKTLLVRTLAQVLRLEGSRVQFTPDLMPADITGTNLIVDEGGTRSFRFQAGPLFANLILADEINRATPKTQSALLEAMQERAVTIGRTRHSLPEPFMVLATQNPIEMEGTYALPEAQLDRFFFKLNVGFPGEDDLVEIATRTTTGATALPEAIADGDALTDLIAMARDVPIARAVTRYAARIVLSTHPGGETSPREVKQFVRHGASPRGVQTLVLAGKIRALMEGRFNVAFEDIRAVAHPSLRHRIILSYEGEAEGMTTDRIVDAAIAATPEAA